MQSSKSASNIVADRTLGIDGSEAVYVADNPEKDFFGARKVAMGTVRVRHRDGLYRHLEPPSDEHAPDAEIEVLDDLEGTLSELERGAGPPGVLGT